jgi:hypothetical protein
LATTNTTSTVGVIFTETLFLGLEIEERFFIGRFDIDWAVVAGSQELKNTYYGEYNRDRF